MAIGKFLLVKDVVPSADSGVDGELELRAIFSIFRNGVRWDDLNAMFVVSKSMSPAQRESAMVASIDNEVTQLLGFGVGNNDMLWPWFR